MKLELLTDEELHQSTKKSAKAESLAAVVMINHLIEVNRRHLYSRFSCSSLYDYCVKELKMTNGDAWRKTSSARLVKEQPELELKLTEGSVTPTHLADAAAFFNREKTTPEEKAKVIKEIENKTTEEAKEILLHKAKDPAKHLKERKKKKTHTITEAILYLDNETMADLKRLQEIWSNAIPSNEISKIVMRLAKEAVERHNPMKKAERAKARSEKRDLASHSQKSRGAETSDLNGTVKHDFEDRSETSTPAPGRTAQWSKSFVEHAVRLRDQGKCTYVDPRTGEACESKHFLEFDHIIPKAMSGEYSPENLRLRCRTHNQRHAINIYGLAKIRSFMKEPAQVYRGN